MSISITNNTGHFPLLQDISTTPWNTLNPQPTSPHILGIVVSFPKAYRKSVNLFLSYCARYNMVYASQIEMSKKLGISARHFRRIIKDLCRLGLIAKKFTGHNKTCWYKISSWFQDEHVRYTLSKKIPFLYYMFKISGTLLISSASHHVLRSIKDLRNNIYIKTKTGPSTKKGDMVFEVKTEIRQDITSLPFKLSLEDQQLANTFTSDVVKRALHKVMSSTNVKNPAKLFLWKCKELAAATGVADNRGIGVKDMVKRPVPQMPCSINPLITKSEEENHQRWEEYLGSKEVQNYLSYYPVITQFNGPQVIQRQHEKYLAKLVTFTEENRSQWEKTASRFCRPMDTQGQNTSIQTLMHNLVIETSNTSPEFEQGCPPTQEKKIDEPLVNPIKKDLTEIKLDYIKKYQDHPQFLDIVHWIENEMETINDNDNPENLEDVDEFIEL